MLMVVCACLNLNVYYACWAENYIYFTDLTAQIQDIKRIVDW